MRYLIFLIFGYLAACQSEQEFSVIGSWKIETIASLDTSTNEFKVFYDRKGIDSLALQRARETADLYKTNDNNIEVEIQEMSKIIAGSLRLYDLITMTFNADCTVYTENFEFQMGNRAVQRWVVNGNKQLRFCKLDNISDTGVVYSIKFLSKNRLVMRQSDVSSEHEVAEYLLVRK
jgi:hypothetical protein